MKHTPGPWSLIIENDKIIIDAPRQDIGNRDIAIIRSHANAEFIVRACNAHEDLLEACEIIFELLENEMPLWYLRKHYNILNQAMAKAQGK